MAFVVAAVVGLALAGVPSGVASGSGPTAGTVSDGVTPGVPAAEGGAGAPAAISSGCGDLTETSHEGTISTGGVRHTYALDGADNCTVTVALTGPGDADFDLYMTVDGRRVTIDDYDRKASGPGSTERIVVAESVVEGGSEISILVDAYRGSGEYELTITPQATGDGGNAVPTASIGANATTVAPGTAVALNGTFSIDPDGTIERYEWDLGDGNATTGETVTHVYHEPGTYTVALTVTDDNGTTATTTRTITVESAETDLGPVDSWASPRNPQPGETTTFVGQPLGANVSADAFEWDFDGDGTTDATGRTATHAFGSEGRHNVTLTVTTGDGTESITTTVVVGSPADDEGGDGDGTGDGPGNVTAPPGEGLGDVSQPGFGPGAAVGALAVVLFGWRIREEAS